MKFISKITILNEESAKCYMIQGRRGIENGWFGDRISMVMSDDIKLIINKIIINKNAKVKSYGYWRDT